MKSKVLYLISEYFAMNGKENKPAKFRLFKLDIQIFVLLQI